MLGFLWGVVFGAILMLLVIYVLLFNPFGEISSHPALFEQFQPLRLPEKLKQFLNEGRTFEWESCYNLSLILHFLFQEHKDSRRLRRWIHKKLQLELSDLTTRNTAGRLIQDIRVRDLSIGCKSPVIKSVCVEDYELSQDESFKLSRLSGKIRLKLTREPFTHWVFAFVDMPTLEFQIDSQWQGKQVKHLIPIITQKFRHMIQRKHVWPNYKIRYRPLFPNPLYQPSPSIGAFEYIKTTGLLEVTVLRCTRLNTALVNNGNSEVFCVVSVDHRPLMQDASRSSTRCITILLNFSRHGISESIGLTFSKLISNTGVRSVQVSTVESSSSAERCGFKAGDVVLAVNNVPVTSERQLSKLLSGTSSELSVLVDRMIYEESNTSFSTLNNDGDDSASLGDFDEISVPENFENVRNKSSQQRSRSATGINSNVASNDFTTNILKDSKMHPCTNDMLIDFSELSEHSVPIKKAQTKTERDFIIKKHIRIRRVRSEAEITKSGCLNSQKLKPLFTTSLENLPYYAHKEIKRMQTNMTEDCIMASAVNKENSGSICSLNTGISAENYSKDFLQSPSRRQRFQARAAEMAAAGKARMSDFWYRHKDNGSGAEIALDALSQHDVDLMLLHTSLPTSGLERRKRSPLIKTKKSVILQNDGRDDTHDLSKALPKTVTTKSLAMNEDVLWDQSLYFELSADICKYLNVTVQARPLTIKAADVTISQDSQIEKDSSQMLGYTSIYIPQVLDDCQLTLSNCHQELFTLRPPFCSPARRKLTPKAAEESRRAGFDERLCYGDILLSFRYFPSGLPTDENRSSVENGEGVKNNAEISRMNGFEASSETRHNFETILLRGAAICAVCRGKVWLKMASHCTSCLLVCHNKCLPKVETACSQLPPIDDSVHENDHMATELSLPSSKSEERLLPRRRRIAVRVSEKLSSTWKSVGRKRAYFHASKENKKETTEQKTPIIQVRTDEVMPVEKAIPDVFSMLELSENLSQMMYQPGNAYNEQMINAAKVAGKDMFCELDPIKRKAKINEDASSF
uniref:PDZ domain-containing protein 8 n=1 Tax=Onchocerca volvulus TaxID=6282 RepID=A0A8R1TUH1_ONCVO